MKPKPVLYRHLFGAGESAVGRDMFMPFFQSQKQIEVLKTIADYRVLTVAQVAYLHFQREQAASKYLKKLVGAGFLEFTWRSFGRSQGRPENVYSAANRGIELLRDKGVLLPAISREHITVKNIVQELEHQLLLNWFRMHLHHIPQMLPDLSVDFLSSKSPLHLNEDQSQPFIHEFIPASDANEEAISFTPDGVFTIRSEEQNRVLLFFVEIDRGTEILGGMKGKANDICQKIRNYQLYFRLKHYKRYEQVWSTKLNGFRLLFVTSDSARMVSLSRLVRDMPPSDFIWLTDQQQMFEHGLADAIWLRGRRQDVSKQSILNAKMCRPSRLPEIKP